MAALRHQIDATERSKANAARSRRNRRIVRGALTVAVVIAAGISLMLTKPLSLFDSETEREARSLGTVIETDAIRFAMPEEIAAEPLTFAGLDDTAGTAWTYEADDLYLSVVLIEFSFQLDQDAADGAFDGAIGGIARRGGGTVIENEPVSQGDPMLGRRVVIEVEGGEFYAEMYANSRWVVQLVSGSEFSTPPDEYKAMIDSFVWQP